MLGSLASLSTIPRIYSEMKLGLLGRPTAAFVEPNWGIWPHTEGALLFSPFRFSSSSTTLATILMTCLKRRKQIGLVGAWGAAKNFGAGHFEGGRGCHEDKQT
jgi:hypothetical protein